MSLSRRRLLASGALAAAAAAAGLPAAARMQEAAAPHALADFFQPRLMTAAALSASGARVALIRETQNGDRRRSVIEVVDAANPSGPRSQIPLGDYEVEALAWANERRLLVRLLVAAEIGGGRRYGSNFNYESFTVRSRRMVSVDVDTGESAVMFENARQRMRSSLDLGWVVDLLRNDPDHVLMAAWEPSGVLALHRMNVVTGRGQLVERGTANTFGWYTQDGVAVVRRDMNARGTMESVYARAPGESGWRLARRTRTLNAPDFAWAGATDRPGVVMVAARLDGEDTESVRELDLRTLDFGPPISRRDGHDVSHALLDEHGGYLGAAYYADRLEYEFADPELAPHHRAMNRFFDDECNVHIRDMDAGRNRLLVRVTGPREPGAWYLYDRAVLHFEHLGSATLLDSRRLAPSERVDVTTRDGAPAPAYLTRPPSGRPGPLVVLVHGGPELRDHQAWDRQAQVLAAQGWWVLQPNFRGSGGYGMAFAQAGWRRWGDRMQEDVEDAIAQVAAEHGLDGERVAIMGTSYGGYAALMGAVRRPDLYKAAIAICCVSDLPELLATERRDDDTGDRQIYRFWVERIGDPDQDRAALEQASPRRRAAEIACPVLLVHGLDDRVTLPDQSRRMHAALQAAGKRSQFIEVSGAGHGDWEDEVEQQLMERYVALLSEVFV